LVKSQERSLFSRTLMVSLREGWMRSVQQPS
jgi:hypothetical protein